MRLEIFRDGVYQYSITDYKGKILILKDQIVLPEFIAKDTPFVIDLGANTKVIIK